MTSSTGDDSFHVGVVRVLSACSAATRTCSAVPSGVNDLPHSSRDSRDSRSHYSWPSIRGGPCIRGPPLYNSPAHSSTSTSSQTCKHPRYIQHLLIHNIIHSLYVRLTFHINLKPRDLTFPGFTPFHFRRRRLLFWTSERSERCPLIRDNEKHFHLSERVCNRGSDQTF